METRAPGSRQKRTLLALAIATAVRVVLKNHTYKVGDTIFRQTEGGPIGLELTGTVSRPFMMKWNKHYLEKVEQAGMSMHLYKIYVDDSNQIAEVLPTGSEYDSETGEIVINNQLDQSEEEDARLARVLEQIANSVQPSIKVTSDHPSKNENKKMAVLDLKVWMDQEGNILFQHYQKPMASKKAIQAKSAHSISCKKSTHVQELVRRMLNTSCRLDWNDYTVPILTEYMRRMREAGYSQNYRKNTLSHAFRIYD